MFPHRYFSGRYFAPRYFPPAQGPVSPPGGALAPRGIRRLWAEDEEALLLVLHAFLVTRS